MTATVMMASTLKNDKESVSAQFKGGGPIGTVLAVAYGDLHVKGYVDVPEIDLPRNGKKLPVGQAVGKNGKLTVIKDMGMRDPYVGQVNLVSGEIAEDFAMYFTASEQTPSVVSLGVLVDDTGVQSAGGLLLQLLPGADEHAIQAIETCLPRFKDISASLQELGADGCIDALLGSLKPVLLHKRCPQYRCDCSRERIERMLVTLGREELGDMIEKEGHAEISCQFCEKKYNFNADELKALLQAADSEEKE